MPKLILAALLLGASLCASAQSYIPLQPAHTGNWYDPASPGEGLELTLLDTDDGPAIFALVFGIEDGRDYWVSAGALTVAGWQGGYPGAPLDYWFELFQRAAPGAEPELAGLLNLRPHANRTIDVAWHVVRDSVTSHRPLRRFYQLTAPAGGWVGRCGVWLGFSPPLGLSNPYWCH